MERTKWSLWFLLEILHRMNWGRYAHFQSRWMPRDMQSFMISYEVATLLKTPATIGIYISLHIQQIFNITSCFLLRFWNSLKSKMRSSLVVR